MSKAKKFFDIIERIEYLRNLLNLNKSRFSGYIGMKPQTYNNFIGAQGSKPNVELIHGVVNHFGVNPMWLLNGSGAIFVDESKSAEFLGRSPRFVAENAVRESGTGTIGSSAANLEALREELQAVGPVLRKAEHSLREMEQARMGALDRAVSVLRRYYEMDPAATIGELREALDRLAAHAEKRD